MNGNCNYSWTCWSRQEDKLFERALVLFPEGTPERWVKIASQVPGRTWTEVKQRYKDLVSDVAEIDSGKVELPNYEEDEEKEVEEEEEELGLDTAAASLGSKGKQRETERRKGIPWTEEEHRLFLIGLQRYGKGDWRSISRNAVVSRTPTQVASHAQKYFLRLNSVKKEKKRPSIHDIPATPSNSSLGQTSNPNTWANVVDQQLADSFGLSNPFDGQKSPSTYQRFGFSM